MGGACSAHGIDKKTLKFSLENLKGRDHLEDLGADGRVILKWMLGKYGWRL
jgi:hypothetical protein